MRVFIAGVDGYLGWPLALALAERGHEVAGIDAYYRRDWVAEIGSQSATPLRRMHSTRYLAMAGWPLALGGALLAEPLVRLLFGPAYGAAAPAIAILVATAGVVAMGHPAVAVVYSQERHRFLVVSSVAMVALNVALDFLLIPTWAAAGAAAANAAAQGVLLLAQTVFAARWLGVRPPTADIARSLGASVVAFAPAAALRAWFAAAGPLPLGLLVVAGLAAYPWLLAAFGALGSGDIARLQAIEAALPPPLRALAGPLLRRLTRWVGAQEPAR
jgi:O-antigen/teichoic acid export membrane protein